MNKRMIFHGLLCSLAVFSGTTNSSLIGSAARTTDIFASLVNPAATDKTREEARHYFAQSTPASLMANLAVTSSSSSSSVHNHADEESMIKSYAANRTLTTQEIITKLKAYRLTHRAKLFPSSSTDANVAKASSEDNSTTSQSSKKKSVLAIHSQYSATNKARPYSCDACRHRSNFKRN